ncbi:MAG: hypothetical protein IKL42_06660 [Clostridia bacterium]|nr:hypothetical protein [Clostridia bacterium]
MKQIAFLTGFPGENNFKTFAVRQHFIAGTTGTVFHIFDIRILAFNADVNIFIIIKHPHFGIVLVALGSGIVKKLIVNRSGNPCGSAEIGVETGISGGTFTGDYLG